MNERQRSVLLIASDTIGVRMAGSGIRYWNLARVIGAHQPVTLAVPALGTVPSLPGVTIVPYGGDGASADDRGARLASIVAEHEIVVAQHLPYLYADSDVLASRFMVIDLYAPWILEKLEYARVDPERGEPDRKDDVAILNRLLHLGDFFLCASERQRDFWLGALAAAGRLSLAQANADATLRALIDVVPFGLPPERPSKSAPGPRGTLPGVSDDDTVVLWSGGIWNWLDPITAIRAIALLSPRLPRIRLVFMGVKSPGAQVAEMRVVDRAHELARELGILDRHVFFNDWVAYDQRQNWLLEADVALSLHVETIEARYAFRTRMLDSFWCGVPSVVTDGDVLADLVREAEIGEVVPPEDAEAVAAAIERALDSDRAREMRANLAALALSHTWENASAPIVAYCRAPWRLDASGTDPGAAYLHELERLYSETAQYARRLEQVLQERERALKDRRPLASTPRWLRERPDLGEMLRRNRERRG